jgi:hypothetical protein
MSWVSITRFFEDECDKQAIWRAANDSPAIWRVVLRVSKLSIVTTLEQLINFPCGETSLNVLLVLIVPDEAFNSEGHPPPPLL